MSKSKDHDEHSSGHGHASHGPPHQHGGGGHEEHEGAPEWLISFADNVMLMMGVFVILLALNMGKSSSAHSSSGDDAQEQSAPAEGAGGYTDEELDFAIAVRAAFNNEVDIDSTDPRDASLVRRLRERLQGADPDEILSGEAPLQVPLGNEEYARVGEIITFAELSTEISEEGVATIESIVPRLAGLRYAVEVRGHASVWETMHEPEKGYRLAYDRALAVGRLLVEHGTPWDRLRIVSCGDSESRAAGVAPERGVRGAERVEIVLSSRLASPPAGPGPGSQGRDAAPGEHHGRLPD